MKITKKKISAFIAVVTALTLMVGAFAYFTDRVNTTATAKTVAVEDIIQVTPDPTNKPTGGDEKTIIEGVWNKNNPNKEIVAPGEEVNLSYDLKNIGDGDIDVKETFILTSTKALNTTSPEWRLFTETVTDDNGAIDGKDGTVVSVEVISGNQVKYTIAGYKLAKGATVSRPYHLVLNKWATNVFQGDTCTVDYIVEMRQHVDSIAPNEGWVGTADSGVTFNAQTVLVVPAA